MRRGITLLRQGRPVEAAGLARTALPTAQQLRDDRLQGYLHYVLAWSMSDLSDPAQADERDRAAFYFERAGDLRGQSLLENEIGTAAYYHGRWDEAVTSYRRAMTLLERLGDTVQAAATRANVGEILADQGYLDDAVETLEAALRLLEIAHHGIGVMLTQGFLARAVARRGDFDRADALYRAAVGEGRSAHAPGLVVDLLTRRAEAAAFARQWDAARGHLDLADREQQTDVMATGRTVRCRVDGILAVAAGDVATARRSFEQGIEIGEGAGLVYETGLTQAAAGQMLDDEELRETARRMLAPLDVVGDPAILALGPLLAQRHAVSIVP
jgi:tetratricopeptide (TPR) repeat protein